MRERTDEERERDRQERERRRARRGERSVHAQPASPHEDGTAFGADQPLGADPPPGAAPPPQQPVLEVPFAQPPEQAVAPPQAPTPEGLAGESPAPPADPAEQQPIAPASGAPARKRAGAFARGARPPAPRRQGRPTWARSGALLALAVVVVAVLALTRSLLRSSHAPRIVTPPVVKVLIPEGKTRVQIAEIAAADHLSGNYRKASRSSPLLKPASYGAPRATPDLEGFLFPATYDMNPGGQVARLVEEQLQAFHEHFGASEIERARALHVTPYQLLIVASMVEREAQAPADRPKIAAVIYNRLRQGMPLGVDATIYYAIEQRTGIATYTHELSEAQLQIDSPYNTRTHVGLPPTPISNPGAASIEAAANPSHAPYLYYVLAADGCGEHVFSRTLAEFEIHAAAYRAALAKNGGHLPACNKK